MILADTGTASAQVFVGSENFSSASLTKNRELGLTLSNPAILESINATLTSDFHGGALWGGTAAKITSVVNAASLQPGLASASWITIFGTDLAPVTDTWTNGISGRSLPASLDGVMVTVDGQPAYLSYISPTQINALLPDVTAGTMQLVVATPDGTMAQTTAPVEAIQPAFFQWGAYAVATHQDFSDALKNGVVAGTTVPAAPGDVIILWGTGFGPTNPAAPVGVFTPSGITYNTANEVTVTLGDMPVLVYGAALAPGFAGLYQVAIQIPKSMADGDYAVAAAVAGVQSPSGVLLTVQD